MRRRKPYEIRGLRGVLGNRAARPETGPATAICAIEAERGPGSPGSANFSRRFGRCESARKFECSGACEQRKGKARANRFRAVQRAFKGVFKGALRACSRKRTGRSEPCARWMPGPFQAGSSAARSASSAAHRHGPRDVRGVSKIAVIVAASRSMTRSTSDWTHPKASLSIIHTSSGGLRGRPRPRKPPFGHETVAWARNRRATQLLGSSQTHE